MKSSTNPFDLSGRVAVVTGGNGGIGEGIATGLAQAGAAIAILARNREKNQQVLRRLQTMQCPAVAIEIDIGERDRLDAALQEVEDTLGDIDILVNNAGHAAPPKGVLGEAIEDWDAVIDTQLNACFLLSKYAAKRMSKRQRGKIINIASMYAIFGSGSIPSYSAAKGGVIQLSKSMAIELAAFNIQVNCITPGWIETAMTQGIKSTPMEKEILLRTPAARWGKPEELAGAAVFLASAAADFVTGTEIRVDGGYSIR